MKEPSVQDPSVETVAAVAGAVGTDLSAGLTAREAAARLASHGPNELRSAPRVPRWRRMLAHFRGPLVYLLIVAAAIALTAWLIEGGHGWPADAMVIAAVVLLNGMLGYLQETKAEGAVAALARMTAVKCTVVRDGATLRIPSREVVRGDILLLAEGDAVAADARLTVAASLRVQEASLTGESEAVLKDVAVLPATAALGDRSNMVFKGTAVAQGTGRAIVTATGMATEMGAIAAMLDAAPEPETPLQQEVTRIGRMLGIAVVCISLVVVTTLLLIAELRSPEEVVDVLLLGVSLAVAAVPEGLPAILSVVLALGVQRMAKHNAIVKKLSSVETLGSASVIASDKTGTLTRGEMTVVRVMTASGSTEISGAGYAPDGGVRPTEGGSLVDGPLRSEQIVALSGGSLAGNAELAQRPDGEWQIQGDPTEAAFLVAEHKLGVSERRRKRFARVSELPFTSERRMMSSLETDREHGDQAVIISKGAPDVLLRRCNRLRVGLDVQPLDDARRARILADVDTLTNAALRTLSVAYRPLDSHEAANAATSGDTLERDLIFVGTVGIIDPPREEAALAIAEARQAGIRVLMITGDHPRTAASIAVDLGIVAPGTAAVSGAELDALDRDAFAATVRSTSVFARVAPAHKLRIVDALRAGGDIVAMTGDGVNDAPALKAADIGIAMGRTGTEVTKEAAKMILADDNYATIVHAVREGRGIFDNIRKVLRYLLCSNMGEVLTVFFGVIGAGVLGLGGAGGAVMLPLLATQLLWINLVTDTAPALAMGLDPPAADLMTRGPRRPGAPVIDARMWTNVAQIGAVTALVTLLTLDIHLPHGLIDGSADLATARTAAFTTLVFASLFTCLHSRSDKASAFSGLFANTWLWYAIGLSVLLQVGVVNLPVLNIAFDTRPLSLAQWLVCIAMASLVLGFGELQKLVRRPRATASSSAGAADHR